MVERRRSDRYPARLQVDFIERKGNRRVETVDVGRHGIFVRMVDPPAERLLCQLQIHLPKGPISVLAVVARRVAPDPGRVPGAGLQFFVLAPEAKDGWDEYVRTLRGEQSPADQRNQPRRLASFLVKLRDVSRLREVYTRDISDGGLFVATPVVRPVGSEVSLVVVHPVTDEEFELTGTVVRHQDGPPKGMAIRLTHFGERDREDFKHFVETGVVALRWRPSSPAAEAQEPVPEGGEDVELDDLEGLSVDEDESLSPAEREIAGSVVVEDGDPEEAQLREAILREPGSLEPRVRLAARLLALGQHDRAVEAAEEAVALEPEHPVALIGLARALVGAGRYAEAQEAFESARRHGHPGDPAVASAIARGLGTPA